MNKENIIELLKQVNYPGFSRNLVDFGMVKDVEKTGEGWIIRLNIVTEDEEKLEAVRKNVEKILTDHHERVAHILIDTKKSGEKIKKSPVLG